MAHALIVEGSDPATRADLEAQFEPMGHDYRAERDPAYKRATWGRRPEDVAAQQAVIADVQGVRQ